jgi:hypothetical protein
MPRRERARRRVRRRRPFAANLPRKSTMVHTNRTVRESPRQGEIRAARVRQGAAHPPLPAATCRERHFLNGNRRKQIPQENRASRDRHRRKSARICGTKAIVRSLPPSTATDQPTRRGGDEVRSGGEPGRGGPVGCGWHARGEDGVQSEKCKVQSGESVRSPHDRPAQRPFILHFALRLPHIWAFPFKNRAGQRNTRTRAPV